MEESIKRQKMRKYVRGKRKSKRLHTWIGISKGEEGEESWAEAIWEEIMAKKKKNPNLIKKSSLGVMKPPEV